MDFKIHVQLLSSSSTSVIIFNFCHLPLLSSLITVIIFNHCHHLQLLSSSSTTVIIFNYCHHLQLLSSTEPKIIVLAILEICNFLASFSSLLRTGFFVASSFKQSFNSSGSFELFNSFVLQNVGAA